ncbi:MAG: phosphatidate cytidylyltransferase [Mangrovibacterium sp.]
MNNLIQRSLTAVVIVAIMLACLFLGEYTFAILFLAIMLGMLHEFFTITESTGFTPHRWITSLISVCIFSVNFLVASGRISSKCFFLMAPVLLITFTHELFANKKHSLQNIAFGLAAIVYITMPLSLTNYIVFSDPVLPILHLTANYDPSLFLVLMVIIWVYDSCAYLFGVSFGKHRLFERVSPKKSWEGAIGGAASAVVVAIFISYYIDANILNWIAISLSIVVSATLGDLTESLIKRQFGVKDSGTIFPGHGGLLDRFDSILFAIPVYICFLELLAL